MAQIAPTREGHGEKSELYPVLTASVSPWNRAAGLPVGRDGGCLSQTFSEWRRHLKGGVAYDRGSACFTPLPHAAVLPHRAALLARQGALASPQAPLAWLRFELEPGEELPSLRLTLWPGGKDRRLASAHPHGAHIDWLA